MLRLIGREEESLHDALQDAFLKILPTLTPFMAIANIKVCGYILLSIRGGGGGWRWGGGDGECGGEEVMGSVEGRR